MSDFVSVYMTVSTLGEAEKIAHALVDEKLAASVNIIPGVRSLFRWEGKVHDEHELILIAQSRMDLFERLKNLVKALHSYSCPCIVALPIAAGHQPYLTWLAQETAL